MELEDFKLLYKVVVIKTVWYWYKDRLIGQWNRTESPEINSRIDGQLIDDKRLEWKKESLFNKWCWEDQTAISKRMKLEHSLMPYTKIGSKWIEDLKVKFLEENIDRMLFDINCSNIFLDAIPRVMKIKTIINKWNLV